MSLNSQTLPVRRHCTMAGTLPTELTNYIVRGANVLQICIPAMKKQSQSSFFVSVEELVTRKHSSIMDSIWSKGVIPESETPHEVRKRLGSSSSSVDDGDISIQETDLSVDLADPYSASIFEIPVRGSSCTHIECFDLETWLNTRPTKATSRKCPHTIDCGCTKGEEPSSPTNGSVQSVLRTPDHVASALDSFLRGVRARLLQENKLRAKRFACGY